MKKVLTVVIALVLTLSIAPTVALANGVMLLSTATYVWTDPASGGEVEITENVYKTTDDLMKWEYVVENIDYNPEPGITNGFSGFQIVFPQQVAEVANQTSPAIGGPWDQNAYSGTAPPWGVEWDAPHPGVGIMPGETGVFSYTTEERERVVLNAPDPGWAHTWGLAEPIIDLDGTTTTGVGILVDQEVYIGAPLTNFPTAYDVEGIDWFDNDASLSWTLGDDIHVEGSAYPTALRDGYHDNNVTYVDPVVLDLDSSLLDGQPVAVDLETGTLDPSGTLGWVPAMDPQISFFDTNGMTGWDDGEDLVLDTDLNGEFGWNTQTYIFYGQNSVPGNLYMDITKELVDAWEDVFDDGIIDLHEKWYFVLAITVTNPSDAIVTGVMVKDNLGGDLGLADWLESTGTFNFWTTGKTEKVHMTWDVGTLAPDQTEQLLLLVYTDVNTGTGNGKKAGHQEYTSEGEHCLNSGATAKGVVELDSIDLEVSYTTDPICVVVGEEPPIIDD